MSMSMSMSTSMSMSMAMPMSMSMFMPMPMSMSMYVHAHIKYNVEVTFRKLGAIKNSSRLEIQNPWDVELVDCSSDSKFV